MVKGPVKVIIADKAKRALKDAYEHIKKDSVKSAEKVRDKLLASIKALAINPHFYPPDKYRQQNDGSYRAYELLKYRITYHVSEDQVTVIRVRHTKMDPLVY
ncbi:type II toxin-antitoxin system RelE/ParE family toxin [Chitinophaga lutea]|uniref:Type II toxin-antitoxin system RelE/ParE family toxin n=1 Tax=Chitinophaga lutea TaxID=2488634 RepID=A0A3N4PYI4_9BACT|nr:type II toxin-antitoxin system RelE/ParE family toxin [Chitinophaga lutea]